MKFWIYPVFQKYIRYLEYLWFLNFAHTNGKRINGTSLLKICYNLQLITYIYELWNLQIFLSLTNVDLWNLQFFLGRYICNIWNYFTKAVSQSWGILKQSYHGSSMLALYATRLKNPIMAVSMGFYSWFMLLWPPKLRVFFNFDMWDIKIPQYNDWMYLHIWNTR